ncbi:hypothetical protein PENTCL1PPCAC_11563, partial [Pristionchus entomophagus]
QCIILSCRSFFSRNSSSKMASPTRPENNRNRQNNRLYRPQQASPFVKVLARKRVIVKQEDDESHITKAKYELDPHSRRLQIPTPKLREAAGSNTGSYGKPTSSNYSAERSFEYGVEDEEDYEVFYDQLPPRLSNTPKGLSPIKHKKFPVSIVNMGKSVMTGRKDNITHEIDMQHLVEKYVNSESANESEAWLVNIGLCEKLNSVTREMERMRGEMSEMWNFVHHQFKAKDVPKDRLTMQTPWPGEGGGCIMPTPFGATDVPIPPNEGDYIVPPLYAKNGVDCGEIYNDIQRKGKKRPGVVFLTHFIRDLFAVAIEPPHKYHLTVRSKNRRDELRNISVDFMRPIEKFFLAACNVTNGLTYQLGDLLREALANELRELRRTPRKEKVTLNENTMRNILKNIGAHEISLLVGENGERGDDMTEQERHEDEVLEEMEEEEVEVEEDI